MKGMISHHSIAILTSEHADIDDLRVCALANGIIRAQREEIVEMDWLIDDIAENGEATTQADADRRPAQTFTSDNVREDWRERCDVGGCGAVSARAAVGVAGDRQFLSKNDQPGQRWL